ncbi:2'-5' RNA ligase family protein [Almyronema epifaneia]|uniref:2'-5' RNA ligase family protein n=1 Tax=Almyronema epifaneia S1 TaxID=2991925 RepID=A0ABW6IHP2_9CYAN
MKNNPKSARFFVALLPTQEICDYANEVKQYFSDRYDSRAAQKSPPHVTLQPPFDWQLSEISHLQSVLTQFARQQSSFNVELTGFGAFPPRVIYINVQRTPALMALQANLSDYLEQRLALVNERLKSRPFNPHLTIAFRDLKPTAFQQAWSEFEHKSVSFAFEAQQVTLLIHDNQGWKVHSQFQLSQT